MTSSIERFHGNLLITFIENTSCNCENTRKTQLMSIAVCYHLCNCFGNLHSFQFDIKF